MLGAGLLTPPELLGAGLLTPPEFMLGAGLLTPPECLTEGLTPEAIAPMAGRGPMRPSGATGRPLVGPAAGS
ncbi:MAG: hypothetical protein ACLQGP_02340, partial [Isosphaeraceae bacterium]